MNNMNNIIDAIIIEIELTFVDNAIIDDTNISHTFVDVCDTIVSNDTRNDDNDEYRDMLISCM